MLSRDLVTDSLCFSSRTPLLIAWSIAESVGRSRVPADVESFAAIAVRSFFMMLAHTSRIGAVDFRAHSGLLGPFDYRFLAFFYLCGCALRHFILLFSLDGFNTVAEAKLFVNERASLKGAYWHAASIWGYVSVIFFRGNLPGRPVLVSTPAVCAKPPANQGNSIERSQLPILRAQRQRKRRRLPDLSTRVALPLI